MSSFFVCWYAVLVYVRPTRFLNSWYHITLFFSPSPPSSPPFRRMLKTVRGTVNHYDESGGGERGSFAGDGGGEHKGERGGREGEEGGDWNKDAEFFMQQYRTVLSFKVSFYDDSKAVWQPLLEPWQLQCVLQPGGYDPKVEIAIEAATAAQINVTRGLIEVLRDLAGQFVSVEMAHRARTGTAGGLAGN